MTHLNIRDSAILVGYNPEGACIYSALMSLGEYWDGEHIWDSDSNVKQLRLEKVRGYLFDSAGELFQEFESTFNLATGIYASGWAKHVNDSVRANEA